MKIAGGIMSVLGLIILIRVIQYELELIWGFPILITGIVLMTLGFKYDKRK